MKGRMICRGVAGIFVLALLSPVQASAVNCKFVLKNLSLPGRTVESVAETMSITEEEIKKCQEEAAAAKDAAGGEAAQAAAGAADAEK
jgi:hypothetical protein